VVAARGDHERMNQLLELGAHPVIGHRGAAAYAPENTRESFRLALRLGADALEFDIRASADGEAMVFHDPVLDRTTDRTGPLAALSAKQLAQVDAGYRFVDYQGVTPFRGTGVRIPTLREVIAEFATVPLLIEVKERGVQDAIARALIEGGAAERAVVAGSDHEALRAFRSAPFTLGASRRDIARLKFRIGTPDPRCRSYAVPESYFGVTVPSRRFVRAAHEMQSTVHVWTVDDAALALKLWLNGANGMVTNRPDVIRKARGAVEPTTGGNPVSPARNLE
jgi:glycerophosphoryl diester phosphodiesterase